MTKFCLENDSEGFWGEESDDYKEGGGILAHSLGQGDGRQNDGVMATLWWR
ncbi:hypothetical protein CCP3SC1_120032 [Gammaproteobacteria bacterium]